MKKRLLIILFLPLLSFGQVHIGQVIDGEIAGDNSGFSISLSSDGSIVAIGAPGNDDNGENSGHVRIYGNQNGVWTQIGQDIDGEDANDRSGRSVSLSSDGSIVAIGAHFNEKGGSDPGRVRIYENEGGNWVQIGQDIDGEIAGDNSGFSISLSSDGTIVAIGAPTNNGTNTFSGHVRVYENEGGNWVQIGQDIDGETEEEISGTSVSLSSDGSIVAIGAPRNDGIDLGRVRVYENEGGNWVQIGQDIHGEMEGDNSGNSISLSSDGSIVAIGARRNDGNGIDSGHVLVYENEGGNWIQIGQDIDGEIAGDNSGISVSLSSDGSIVSIGAPQNDGNGESSGHVRVFDLSALLSTEENIIPLFSIYPNPASTNVTIQLDQNSVLEKSVIYNSLGQIVKKSTEVTMDTSDLSKGMYILEVTTDQGKASKKLIIE
jgi:hypothetical protein